MVEFDKDGLEKFINGNDTSKSYLKLHLDEFFSQEQVIDTLDNNDFKKFYELERIGYHGSATGNVTTILYLSDIDPLKYLDFIPKNCFTAAPIKLIDIPSNIKQIKEYAFSYCKSLESVIIPDSIEYIDDFIFLECKNLKEIHYSGTIEQWFKITKSEECFSGSNIQKIICLDGVVEVS